MKSTKKRLISAVLALCLTAGCFALPCSAARKTSSPFPIGFLSPWDTKARTGVSDQLPAAVVLTSIFPFAPNSEPVYGLVVLPEGYWDDYYDNLPNDDLPEDYLGAPADSASSASKAPGIFVTGINITK